MSKTIAALSTPVGLGGIGVIRISGDDAISIAEKAFKSVNGRELNKLKGYTACFGNVYNIHGDIIDQCVATVFRAPNSYTGENVVELSVHGGKYSVDNTLKSVLDNGAYLAENGEFTKRAFINGKMDLAKAESVMNLINAQTEKEGRASLLLHESLVNEKINFIKESLLNISAGLSVYADYPDEDLPEFSDSNLRKLIDGVVTELKGLIADYEVGKVLKEGISTVIAGSPNVGKSTLMNLLSGCTKSIVTDIPGTTRDVIEEIINLGNVKLLLSDTAGLRESNDKVEEIGIEFSREKIKSANLIIAVFDGSKEACTEDINLIHYCHDVPSLCIVNKNDLNQKFDLSLFGDMEYITISAKESNCLDLIREKVEKICGVNSLTGDEVILANNRQRDCCVKALDNLVQAVDLMNNGFTMDAVGVLIDDSLTEILALTGEKVTTAVVDEIFKNFCVGK